MDLKSVPLNFEIIKSDENKLFIINKTYRKIILEMINDLTSLKEQSNNQFVQGRAKHWLLQINKSGLGRVVVRRYRRGGLINQWFLGDLFYGISRPINELNITESARQQKAAVPEILGVILKRAFGPFWRAEIIFKEIPDAGNLFEIITDLKKYSNQLAVFLEEKKKIIRAVAGAIKKLHQAGVFHHDLQLRNILVQKQPDGS
ncbi:MAG: lipopolysaccharide kinase InaA family protein, partial [Planctomycetota bacterium]